MEWFGKSWNAPCCRACEHTATPVGKFCLECRLPIRIADQGIIIPHLTDARQLTTAFFHLDCFLASIFGRDRAREFK